jgi:hypothetical protein
MPRPTQRGSIRLRAALWLAGTLLWVGLVFAFTTGARTVSDPSPPAFAVDFLTGEVCEPPVADVDAPQAEVARSSVEHAKM